jgi:hypothetical protein
MLYCDDLSSPDVACVEIRGYGMKVYLVSAYFRHKDRDVSKHVAHLERIFLKLSRKGAVVVGADLNAYSPLWYGDKTCMRGRHIEDFIARHGVEVANRPNQLPTYRKGNNSNIDATLIAGKAHVTVADWQVRSGLCGSDHRVISFTLKGQSAGVQTPAIPLKPRYRMRRSDFGRFADAVAEKAEGIITGTGVPGGTSIDEDVASLQEVLQQAASSSLRPAQPPQVRTAPWWDAKVAAAQKTKQRLRRRYQRCKDPAIRAQRRKEFTDARNRFTTVIREAKQRCWDNFVSKDLAESNPFGLVYRLAAGKLRLGQVLTSITDDSGLTTTDIEETARCLLEGLVPSDSPVASGAVVPPPRQSGTTMNQPDSFTADELGAALKRFKARKAPGNDGITAEMVKASFPVLSDEYLRVFNRCLEQGVFPKAFKHAEIRPLLKGPEKDPTRVKSYRPISLLPVLGKWLERLIADRIETHLESVRWLDDRQFGYRKGLSTTDALNVILENASPPPGQLVLGLFLDISGAFDNARWNQILAELTLSRCPSYLVRLVESYLSERTAGISTLWWSVEKKLNKGTPQGSILGPLMWKVLFNVFIKLPWPAGCTVVAYVDDATVLITGPDVATIERKVRVCAALIEGWAEDAGMVISASKTQAILFRGPPAQTVAIRLCGETVDLSEEVKCLGVVLDRRLTFRPHIRETVAKAKVLSLRLIAVARRRFGIKHKAAKTIYRACTESVLTYGVGAWWRFVERNRKVSRSLSAGARPGLFIVAQAYRTVSTDALYVLSGIMPIHLRAKVLAARHALKRGGVAGIGSISVGPARSDRHLGKLCLRVEREAMRLWQLEWDKSFMGDVTRSYWPTLKARLAATYFQPNKTITEYMTGHGRFSAFERRLRLKASPEICACGSDTSPEHLIWKCPKLAVERDHFLTQVRQASGRAPSTNQDLLENRTAFEAYRAYVRTINHVRTTTPGLPDDVDSDTD